MQNTIKNDTTMLRGILAAHLSTNKTKNGQPVTNILLRIPEEKNRVIELAGFGGVSKSFQTAKCGSEMILGVRNLRTGTYEKNGVTVTREKATVVHFDYANKLDRMAEAEFS